MYFNYFENFNCRVVRLDQETKYPLLDELEHMANVPYVKVSNVKESYEDIVGTYDAIFDEIGNLGESGSLLQQVKFMNLTLEVVEEYTGCLPADADSLVCLTNDPHYEKWGLHNNVRRLVRYIPAHLLERIRYLDETRHGDKYQEINSIDYLFGRCQDMLRAIELAIGESSSGTRENIDPDVFINMNTYSNTVNYHAHRYKNNELIDIADLAIPIEIYDFLRNDDQIGFNAAFLNFEFGVTNIRDLYERMETLLQGIYHNVTPEEVIERFGDGFECDVCGDPLTHVKVQCEGGMERDSYRCTCGKYKL